MGAHPRGCGEHPRERGSRPHLRGSSPRVRGTFGGFSALEVAEGLIPAGAGNIFCFVVINSISRAHPRGCGEHY